MEMANFIIIVIAILFSAHFVEQAQFSNDIKHIHKIAKTWKAKRNFHPNITKEQIVRLLGSIRPKGVFKRIVKEIDPLYENITNIPSTFDARKYWKKCKTIGQVRNQGNCGSCWAHSTTGAFADRLCIATNGKFNQLISVEELAFCCPCGQGCNGGYPLWAWDYIKTHGLVTGGNYNTTDGCQPYTIPPCLHYKEGPGSCLTQSSIKDPICYKSCYGEKKINYEKDHHKTMNSYSLTYQNIKKDVLVYGPIEVSFDVYDDFPSYKSGVYQKTEDASYLGGHSVKLIGWGEENNIPYWLIVNSWGEQFGNRGLFKIRRGNNECGIEEEPTADSEWSEELIIE